MPIPLPKFGPAAQTVAQRTLVVARMKNTFPALAKRSSPCAEQAYGRYIAGELSWLQVRQELDTAPNAKERAC